MYKLISISGNGCAGCVSLHEEVRQILPSFPQLHVEYHSLDEHDEAVDEIIKAHSIEKIPALLLMQNEEAIGCVTGYQPAEILTYWLEDKLKD